MDSSFFFGDTLYMQYGNLLQFNVAGYYSWRNTTRGSWFIQALCDQLKHRGFEMDLVTLLTFVSQRVAFDFESNCPDSPTMHQQKQIPCIMSMLTRLIQFTRVKEG
jgi:caspase 7